MDIQRDAHENMRFISYSHWIVAKYDLPVRDVRS